MPESLSARLMERFGAQEVLLTDSGTSALQLAIALGVAPGKTVAMPAYGCYDLATAAVGADRRVVLYDVDPRTLGPDETSLHAALSGGVDALVVAPLYGMPVAVNTVHAACERAGVVVIEDAAQGAGASLCGRPVGSWGSVSVLSFGRGKGVTGGGGGALLAHDEKGLHILRRAREACRPAGPGARAVIQCAALYAAGRPSVYRVPASLPFLRLGDTVYRGPRPPAAMPRPVAGMVARALARTGVEERRRSVNARRLLRAVQRSGDLEAIAPVAGAAPGFLRLPVMRTGPQPRPIDSARELGVAPGYPRTLAELPQLRGRVRNGEETFSGAQHLADRLVTLPTHGLLSDDDVARLETWIVRSPDGDAVRTALPSGGRAPTLQPPRSDRHS